MAKAIVGAAITAGLTVAFGPAGFEAGAFFKTFSTHMLIMAASQLLSKSGKQQSQPSFQAEARDRLQVVRSAVETRRIIYGQMMVSGPLVYAESKTVPGVPTIESLGSGGSLAVAFNNILAMIQASVPSHQFLHLVIPVAGHECEEIGDIYFNDESIGTLDSEGNVTTGRYAGLARIKKHLGATDQAADTDLIAETSGVWTSNHRLRGVAYIYVRLLFNADAFPTGIPNIKAVVKGKKVYDPRLGSPTTLAWSDNWALCVRDYLASPLGLDCSDAEINDADVIAAANICDEMVATVSGSPSADQKRYTMNGTVNLADQPLDIMRSLLSAAAGACVYTQGQYRVFAGAYSTPVMDIDESDLRAGAVQVSPRPPRRELFNAVRGTFTDPDKFWQPTDFPAVTNATYETADGGQQIVRDIELPFTTDGVAAQRIAKIHLEKSRQGMTVRLPCKLTVFKLAVWDTVRLSIDRLGFDQKVFRVTGWQFAEAGGVDLELSEESSASYDWAGGDATTHDTAPNTVFPDPFTVGAPGTPVATESLYETTGSTGVKARALITWAGSVDVYVNSYQLEYRLSGESDWIVRPLQRAAADQIDDLAPGTYEFRVKAINSLGISSDYSATTTQELFGLTAAPATLTNFTVIKNTGFALAQWDLHADLDVRIGGRIIIAHAPASTGVVWNDCVTVGEANGDAVQYFVPLLTGTYMAKARDSSGNYSGTAVSFVATEGMVTGFTTVDTITEDPGYAGTKSGTEVDTGNLQIADIGSPASIPSSGTYLFADAFDHGSVATRRLEVSIEASAFDIGQFFDDDVDMFDSPSLFDADGDIDGVDVVVYGRFSDNPSGSPTPTWSEWAPFRVADFTYRSAEFKAVLLSDDPSENIAISQLRVTAKIPA